jgi:hypothetical protein
MRACGCRRVLPPMLLLVAVLWSPVARGEVEYRDGLRVTGSAGGMALNLFVRPRYVYESDDGTGSSRSTFSVDLLGARLRAWDQRGVLSAQIMGGLAVDEAVLLDTYVEVRPWRTGSFRFGHFRVGYDEQTTHGPFWLRMTRRSIDVDALSYEYDVGVALQGTFLDDALAFSLSVTNGETPSLENVNLDFLYAGRLALRLGPVFDWRRADLVLGAGVAWTLEPWEPEAEVTANRSVLSATFDVSGRIGAITATAAALYRYVDPGAYGSAVQGLGWHLEAGAFVGEYFEFAIRAAHLVPDLEVDGQRVEMAAAINGFPDRGRLRVQLEYAYTMAFDERETDWDAHRVVVQWQALY